MTHPLLLAMLLILSAASTTNAQTISKELFFTRWDSTENYLTDMISSMPAFMLSFRPTDSIFTSREQVAHIYRNLNSIHGRYFAEEEANRSWELPDCDKACLQQALVRTFGKVRNTVKGMDADQLERRQFFHAAGRELSRYELLYLMLDHTRHHAGQLVIYLRLNGITPPRFTGW